LAKVVEANYGDYDRYSYEDDADLDEELPLKWLAPEVLAASQFSTCSDIWAFGVLGWEIWTRGLVPYGKISRCRELLDFLKLGERLRKPFHSPNETFNVFRQCWEINKRDRPSVNHMAQFFETLYNEMRTNMTGEELLPPRKEVSFSISYDYPGQVLRPTSAGNRNSQYACAGRSIGFGIMSHNES